MTSSIKRQTKETTITSKLTLQGSGSCQIETGIGFFDHMLTHIGRHGFFDMTLKASGDLDVDSHHLIEDVGIVFGQNLTQALGDKKGIKRYGSFLMPMDETLILCAIDLSGRSYLNFDCDFSCDLLGGLQTEMIEEFFRAVSDQGKMTLHIRCLEGKNNHHIAEGIFKAFGRALDEATSQDPRIKGVMSTKGMLE